MSNGRKWNREHLISLQKQNRFLQLRNEELQKQVQLPNKLIDDNKYLHKKLKSLKKKLDKMKR